MVRKRRLKKLFARIVGDEKCWIEEEVLASYSFDAYPEEPVLPDIVVMPTHTEQIGEIIALCNRLEIPLTVRGSGTNLSGGTVPVKGGCVMLTTALNRILEINKEDMYARVEPGVITQKLADAVEREGLLYPPDPASMKVSTIGGNVAENSGGLRALKYGVTDRYVMEVKFYDAFSNFVKSGGIPVKLVTGFNLKGLMISSEGLLGVISEVMLKLVPPPQAKKTMLVFFDDVMDASRVVSEIIISRILPATLEIMDNFTIKTVERFHRIGLPTDKGALLLIEVDGHPAAVEDEYVQVERICRKYGGEVHIAKKQEDRDKLWQARRDALSSLAMLKPTLILEDATVPRSKVPEMMKIIQDVARKYNLLIGTFGHAGDGNLHPTILTDKRDEEEMKRVNEAIDEIFERTLELGGTLSGEHGVGIAKKKYMEKEVGRGTLLFYERLKKGLDPKGIFNPGKVI